MKFQVILSVLATACTAIATDTPVVKINNGSISGLYLEDFSQDAYLGIPFAAPPTGKLRFANPEPFNSSWGDEVREFKQYGDACLSSAGDLSGMNQSENCLSLNVIKPHGDNYTDLPVAIWIHGGSFTSGSSSKAAYNLSFIVDKANEIGQPFIGVSINYRLNGFGFMHARPLGQNGWSNMGLRDQIKAVHWVHENIKAFGGNPEHIIIWGESAGGISVGKLLVSDYLGDFVKGAIMESGNPLMPNTMYAGSNEKDFASLLSHFNCSEAIDAVECLQDVDQFDLRDAFNLTNKVLSTGYAYPYVDQDVITKSSYQRLKEGNYYKIPILIGENTDEGTSFTPTFLNSTDEAVIALMTALPHISTKTIKRLLSLYPANDTSVLAPLQPNWNTTEIYFPPSVGKAWRNTATLVGDLLFSGTGRIVSKIIASQGVPVFRYRFNIPDQMITNWYPWMGAAHFQEVVYVFNNDEHPFWRTNGESWNPDERSVDISSTMTKMWASFITNLDPNAVEDHQLEVDVGNGWPEYSDSQENFVFDLNGFYLEDDDWREEQIDVIESLAAELTY